MQNADGRVHHQAVQDLMMHMSGREACQLKVIDSVEYGRQLLLVARSYWSGGDMSKLRPVGDSPADQGCKDSSKDARSQSACKSTHSKVDAVMKPVCATAL